jgi:hypothetical protein
MLLSSLMAGVAAYIFLQGHFMKVSFRNQNTKWYQIICNIVCIDANLVVG